METQNAQQTATEKTGKVTKCQFKNEWKNPNNPNAAPTYYHDIELDNGDKGSIGTKEMNSPKIAVGATLTYTIEGNKIKALPPKNEGGGWSGKGGGGFKGKSELEIKMTGATMVLSYVKDLVVADKIKPDEAVSMFNKLFDAALAKCK